MEKSIDGKTRDHMLSHPFRKGNIIGDGLVQTRQTDKLSKGMTIIEAIKRVYEQRVLQSLRPDQDFR